MTIGSLFGRRSQPDPVHDLYVVITHQSRLPDFYLRLDVPDTVDGRFDMITLHAFLVLHRLKAEGEAAAPFAQAFFDLMFADMDRNLREMGAGDMGVGTTSSSARGEEANGAVARPSPPVSSASSGAPRVSRASSSPSFSLSSSSESAQEPHTSRTGTVPDPSAATAGARAAELSDSYASLRLDISVRAPERESIASWATAVGYSDGERRSRETVGSAQGYSRL